MSFSKADRLQLQLDTIDLQKQLQAKQFQLSQDDIDIRLEAIQKQQQGDT